MLLPLQAREVPEVEVGGVAVEGEHDDVGCVESETKGAAIRTRTGRPAAGAAKGQELDDGRRPFSHFPAGQHNAICIG